ncbi:uncharacterized protein LOC112183918 [Rosa chinensis]|uniref:uncharacterized protein LOC112183918 n=1 Tax=Rosa chinensis TaxID=74649 RepID=UPI000D08CA4E|nr:uncharacterized protein LOC112183918 [Rosa chinensis]
MEQSRDRAAGGSVNSPPWFDGGCEKYNQWKIYMKSYMYAQDEHVWNIVENCWKTPTVPAKGEGLSAILPKPRKDWTEEEVRDLQADFKIKNNIFTTLSEREKLRISHCDTAKQAWDLLQTTYEGNKKVTIIEDSFDIDDYPLDELIGNLKTYELRLKLEKKSKGMAFKAAKGTEEEDESLDLALLTKEFKKFLRNKSSSRNFNAPKKNFVSSASNDNNVKSGKGNFKGSNSGKIKCYECGGYGHISTDCGNRKHGNSNNKSLLPTWSDDEHQEVENVAFVSSLSHKSESDEGFSDDETTVRCKQLYKSSKATLLKNPSLEDEVVILKAEKEKLELMWRTSQTTWEQERNKFTDELHNSPSNKSPQTWKTKRAELKNKVKILELEEELNSTQEKFTKFEISSGIASKLFSSGKAHHDTFGLGYSGEGSKSTCFMRETNQVVEKDISSSHIEATCLVALTALADKRKDFWYVDSGCSRHMTGDKAWFTLFQDESTTSSVTFGDGRKAKILARGTVNAPGIPNLKNFLYVEGLTANLISVSHLADDYEDVWFNKQRCVVLDKNGENIIGGKRSLDNCYHIQANESLNVQACFSVRSTEETFEIWHRRLGHVNYQDLLKLSTKQCIRGLPALSGRTDKICGGCKTRKQTKSPHQALNSTTTTRVLELLHMDLMGPAQTESLGGLSQRMIIEKQSTNMCLVRVRSDNGAEFKNATFANYFHELGVSHEFSAPITPQQNGIVERKNRAEAISTACYTINRVFLRPGTKQTAYELWKGKKPNIGHFRVFGSSCYILRDREQLGKFDARSDDGIFLGYSINSRAYRVYNKRTRIVMESINVSIDDHYIRQEEVFAETSSSPSLESGDTSVTDEKEENVDSIFELAPQMRRGFKQV